MEGIFNRDRKVLHIFRVNYSPNWSSFFPVGSPILSLNHFGRALSAATYHPREKKNKTKHRNSIQTLTKIKTLPHLTDALSTLEMVLLYLNNCRRSLSMRKYRFKFGLHSFVRETDEACRSILICHELCRQTCY